MAHQIRRTRTLVASLLNFAKQTPAQKTLVNVNSLVQTALKLAQPQLQAYKVPVDINLVDHPAQVLGDSNQLLQVCLHIINNAGHTLSGTTGRLRISTGREGNAAILEFSDSGPAAKDAERTFELFPTMNPSGRGKDAGMSTCYGIVQEHHGRITCVNRAEGGAVFRIELPIANARSASAEDSSTSLLKGNVTLTLGPTPGVN
jgi:two-component system C4-dicarboxylate transport sensor histidine kinase DctB